jgi:signal transduction histidine kinase
MINLILIAVAAVCILIGTLIFISDHRKLINLLTSVINFSMAAWIFTVMAYTLTQDPVVASILSSIYFSLAAIFAALVVILAYALPDNKKPPRVIVVSTVVACYGVIMGLIVPGFLTGKEYIGDGYNCHDIGQIPLLIYCLYFATAFGFSIYIMIRKYVTAANRADRLQLGIFLFGSIAMTLPAAYFDLYLQYFGDCHHFSEGSLTPALFALAISYGIIRHRLFDIRLAAVRTLAYVFALGLLVAIYYAIAIVVSGLFSIGGSGLISENPLNVILIFALLFVFQPIKRFFDHWTNKLFYRDYYDSDAFLDRLNKILSSTSNLRKLLEQASQEIASTLKSEQAFFFIQMHNGHYISAGTKQHTQLNRSDVMDVYEATNGKKDIAIVSMMDSSHQLNSLMSKHRIDVVLPLIHDGLVGYLFLGDHLTSHYTNRDIKVLSMIGDSLVIAIQNVMSIEEIRESNTELRQIDKIKDEFVSVASHELRTPMTVIRGYVDLLRRQQLGPENDQQQAILNKISLNTKTLIDLVNDMLDLSKLETNSIEINSGYYPVDELVNHSLDQVKIMFANKGLDLSFQLTGKPNDISSGLQIKTDPHYFERIMMNLLSNAYKFTDKGGVKVEASVVKSNDAHSDDTIMITVADTGVGVPKKSIGNLFKKFSQVDNYLQRETSGTGLGLAISKRLVERLGGKIWVKSQPGVGSEFYFTMPSAENPDLKR